MSKDTLTIEEYATLGVSLADLEWFGRCYGVSVTAAQLKENNKLDQSPFVVIDGVIHILSTDVGRAVDNDMRDIERVLIDISAICHAAMKGRVAERKEYAEAVGAKMRAGEEWSDAGRGVFLKHRGRSADMVCAIREVLAKYTRYRVWPSSEDASGYVPLDDEIARREQGTRRGTDDD